MDKPELELSQNVITGLRNLGTKLNMELSKKLLANVAKLTLFSDPNVPANPEVYATEPNYVKHCEFAVTTLFVLSCKYDYDKEHVRTILENCEIMPAIIDEIEKIFDICKKNLLPGNIRTGIFLPHLTEVDWTVSCNVPAEDNVNNTVYTINLGKFDDATGNRECITEFNCNVEELESLLMKFKDIESHCKKVCS